MTERSYQVTFIIDLRATKRSIPDLTSFLKEAMTELGAKVTSSEDLGVKDFAYVTQKNNTSGHYLRFQVEASGNFNDALQARLRLEEEVKQAFVESARPARA
jgi:ribosomal protein S6